MCQDSVERSRAIGLSCIYEDFNANLNYIDSLCMELHISPKLLYLTAFNRGSLMKPKWQKLASLAQEICTL